jgi:hypothetical protein
MENDPARGLFHRAERFFPVAASGSALIYINLWVTGDG